MTAQPRIQPPDSTNLVNTPPPVFVLNKDLFFGVAIANALRELGYSSKIVRSAATLDASLATDPNPALIIVDIAAVDNWDALRDTLAAVPAIPSIAFGAHTDVEGLRSAKLIGMERVFSNGEFHRTMGATISRYALPGPLPPNKENLTNPNT